MNKTEVSQPINMQSAAEMGTEEYHDISWVSNRQIGRFSSSAPYRRPTKISAKAAVTCKFMIFNFLNTGVQGLLSYPRIQTNLNILRIPNTRSN